MAWDPELLKPFLSRRKSDHQPSEAEMSQELIAEGTAFLLYQRMKEEVDSKLQSGWLFFKTPAQLLSEPGYWSEQFLKDFSDITNGSTACLKR